jgi:DNA-binding transcriptional LysR family regulator
METSNTEFIKELVQRGEGISLLVKAAVAREISEGKLLEIPLKGGRVYLDVSIAYLENQPLSPSAKAFLDTLENLQYRREITPQGIGKFMAKIMSQQKLK